MNEIKIVRNSDGFYELEECPFNFKPPMACQAKGCPYWNGYLYKNVCYLGFRDYISSMWRKSLYGKPEVATFVRCGFGGKKGA